MPAKTRVIALAELKNLPGASQEGLPVLLWPYSTPTVFIPQYKKTGIRIVISLPAKNSETPIVLSSDKPDDVGFISEQGQYVALVKVEYQENGQWHAAHMSHRVPEIPIPFWLYLYAAKLVATKGLMGDELVTITTQPAVP